MKINFNDEKPENIYKVGNVIKKGRWIFLSVILYRSNLAVLLPNPTNFKYTIVTGKFKIERR